MNGFVWYKYSLMFRGSVIVGGGRTQEAAATNFKIATDGKPDLLDHPDTTLIVE